MANGPVTTVDYVGARLDPTGRNIEYVAAGESEAIEPRNVYAVRPATPLEIKLMRALEKFIKEKERP